MIEQRTVVITIASLLEIVKDYTQQQVPAGARAVKLMFNPQERKIAIVAESDEWGQFDTAPIGVKFEVRRVHRV